MPKREEIAGWLREAADLAYDYSALGIEHYNLFDKRADEVEAMRCEGCKHWHRPNGLRSDYCTGMKWNEVNKMGADFGCFHWEAKE